MTEKQVDQMYEYNQAMAKLKNRLYDLDEEIENKKAERARVQKDILELKAKIAKLKK